MTSRAKLYAVDGYTEAGLLGVVGGAGGSDASYRVTGCAPEP